MALTYVWFEEKLHIHVGNNRLMCGIIQGNPYKAATEEELQKRQKVCSKCHENFMAEPEPLAPPTWEEICNTKISGRGD